MTHRASHGAVDAFQRFLRQADRVVKDARFVVDSLPNVEPFAVERALLRLRAVHDILTTFQDPWLKPAEIGTLVDIVVALGQELEAFQAVGPPPRNIGTCTLPSTGGRPRYDLDLQEAIRLHDNGSPWGSVADALGVSRGTLNNHLRDAGLSSARPKHTEIGDDDLDEKVAEISMKHPFAGYTIVGGHLRSKDIHVSKERIRESLRRVDALGTVARSVSLRSAAYQVLK